MTMLTSMAGRPMPRPSSSPVQLFGMAMLLLFCFLAYSRLTDILLPNLYLLLIASILAFVAAVPTGGLKLAFGAPTGLCMLAFTLWLIFLIPFSYWPGGSFQLLREYWIKSFFAFVIVAGLPRSTTQVKWTMYSIGAGTIVITLMCMAWGAESAQGRLIGQAGGGGVMSNPNDLAQLLLVGLPFVLLIGMSGSALVIKRSIVAVSIAAILRVIMQTGSRGAIVAILSTIVAVFIASNWAQRLKLTACLVVIAAVAIPAMSPEQARRYATIFQEGNEENLGENELSAIGSREQRWELLQESVKLTFQNPIFGVGPGQFQSFTAERSSEQGERGVWRETHNTFTQVSSECGLPGFLLFMGVLVTSFRSARHVSGTRRSDEEEASIASSAYCLWLSLLTYTVTSFFSSVAYGVYLPTLAGLSVAFARCRATESVAIVDVALAQPNRAVATFSASPVRQGR